MMFWDFSIRQRAEDRFQEGQNSAAEQRLLKMAIERGEVLRKQSKGKAGAVRPRVGLVSRLRRKVAAIAGISFLLIALVGTTSEAMSSPSIIRNIAEGVLGEGSVTAARISEDGGTAVVRWQSATYKPGALSVPEARELIYVEAALATGAILGRLPDVVQIRFTIMRGDRILATGENSRHRHLWVAFAKELGGGLYNNADPRAPKISNTEGGQPLQDL